MTASPQAVSQRATSTACAPRDLIVDRIIGCTVCIAIGLAAGLSDSVSAFADPSETPAQRISRLKAKLAEQKSLTAPQVASAAEPLARPAAKAAAANRVNVGLVPQASQKKSATLARPTDSTGLKENIPAGLSENFPARRRSESESHLIFDIPVTYNDAVKKWIHYFQTTGRGSFRRYLERSTRYMPYILGELKRHGLPLDLAYVPMIESGFIPSAISHAGAMGLWQFIEPTGRRYGLRIDWWIDERRDYRKATASAIRYMKDLQQQFKSWYLVAASYNMGETGVRRLIQRHGTNSFWELADLDALPDETQNYVPKILAAMLIAKAPALYGFRDLNPQSPLEYDEVEVPGGTDLINLGKFLGVSEKHLEELNPELIKSFIPREVRRHRIRVPKGARLAVEDFLAANADSANSLGNDLASVDAASR
jgi:membrane-bound lytic murein transglycosylase D